MSQGICNFFGRDRLRHLHTTDRIGFVYRFKGLERPVVVLVEIDERLQNDDLMYVGVSRARSHLVVVGAEGTLAALGSPLRGPAT